RPEGYGLRTCAAFLNSQFSILNSSTSAHRRAGLFALDRHRGAGGRAAVAGDVGCTAGGAGRCVQRDRRQRRRAGAGRKLLPRPAGRRTGSAILRFCTIVADDTADALRAGTAASGAAVDRQPTTDNRRPTTEIRIRRSVVSGQWSMVD